MVRSYRARCKHRQRGGVGVSVSGAFAQGSRMAAWCEDRYYEEPDEDCMSPEDIAEEMAERQREWDDDE